MTWQTVLALGEVQARLETRKEDVRHVECDVAGGTSERGVSKVTETRDGRAVCYV